MPRRDVARAGVRYSYDPLHGFAWGLNATAGHGYDAESGLVATVPGVGALPDPRSGPTWFEYTARLGYTVAEHLTLSVFVTGVAGSQVGSHTDWAWTYAGCSSA